MSLSLLNVGLGIIFFNFIRVLLFVLQSFFGVLINGYRLLLTKVQLYGPDQVAQVVKALSPCTKVASLIPSQGT